MCEGTIAVAKNGVFDGFFLEDVRSPWAYLHVSPNLQLPLAKLCKGAFDLKGLDDVKALMCTSLSLDGNVVGKISII